MKSIQYIASPTGRIFHKSKALVRGIKGCVGSGKTVACINELHMLAIKQAPNEHGKRLSRTAIIRNTTPELRMTTLATFKGWIPEKPEGVCKIVHNPIIRAHVKYALNDETQVDWEVYFLALDRPEDTRKLLSLELTGVFINEAKEIDFEVLLASRERIGRYPAAIDGYPDDGKACTRKYIIMDTNPPSDHHWWYEKAEIEKPEGFGFFDCPSPLLKQPDGTYSDNPEAENIKHLPGGYRYYHDLIPGMSQERINVMVLGNYGETRAGKLVYTEYSDALHCNDQELGILEGIPVGIGMDGGLTPSAVFGQITQTGQLRVFAELSSNDMDVMMFARDVVKPFVSRNFDPDEILFCYFDPSGVAGKENQMNPVINMLNDNYISGTNTAPPLLLPFYVEAASTNNIERRLGAVRSFLSKIIYGGQPGLHISTKCKMLRRGFQGGYCYKKLGGNALTPYREKPDKNIYSHCFLADTLISTKEGQTPIWELRAGDKVKTPHGLRKVMATMNREVFDYLCLTLNDGTIIKCTANHGFYTTEGIVLSQFLTRKDLLRNREDKKLHIVNKERISGKVTAYDLTIDEVHKYYAEDILVSNCADALQYLALGFMAEVEIYEPTRIKQHIKQNNSAIGY